MRRMFSEKQIKRMIAENPAAVLEALAGQDIKAKTLKQSDPNWKLETFELKTSADAESSGLTVETVFNRVEEINGRLYIVFINKINNPTESAVTLNYLYNMYYDIELPSALASKIYDYTGETATQSANSNTISCSFKGAISIGSSYYEAFTRIINIALANKIRINIQPAINITLNAGASAIYEDRIFLTVI